MRTFALKPNPLFPKLQQWLSKKGGDSTISIHPALALEKINQGVKKALQGDLQACLMDLPKTFQVEIIYKEHTAAYKASFYPVASLKEPHAIAFETGDYFEVLRLLSFVI